VRLGIAIKMASIGEGDYQVVKKRALCCSRSVCFFFSSESFKTFGLPPEKKTGGKLWAGPPILVAAAVAVAVVAAAALGIIVASCGV
jgi:hypothetical protein